VQRSLLAAFSVLTAVAVAALVGSPDPLTNGKGSATFALGATSSPTEAAGTVVAFLGNPSAVWIEAIVFAAAAATTSLARSRGLLGIGIWGAAFLAAALLAPAGAVGVFPLVLAVCGAAVLLAIPTLRRVL
jgi:hypothetical protein